MKAPPPPHLWMYSNNLHMVIEYEIQIQYNQPISTFVYWGLYSSIWNHIRSRDILELGIKGRVSWDFTPQFSLRTHPSGYKVFSIVAPILRGYSYRMSNFWLGRFILYLDNNDFLNLIFVDFSKPMFSHILFIDWLSL